MPRHMVYAQRKGGLIHVRSYLDRRIIQTFNNNTKGEVRARQLLNRMNNKSDGTYHVLVYYFTYILKKPQLVEQLFPLQSQKIPVEIKNG